MKVTVAGDHYACELMTEIKHILQKRGYDVEDRGSTSKEDRKVLQEIIPLVTQNVNNGDSSFGVLACGTGVGVEIGANRFKGIRASLCRDAEQAKNARIYDNANVLCLGSWYKDNFEAILNAWLSSDFDGNESRKQMLKDFDELK